MKKILLFMSAATMFAAISCNKVEVNSPQTQTPSVNHTHESIEFVAYTEVETKTTLNGYATEWEAGDEIDINEVVYIAQESGNKSVFTIVDPEAEVPEAPYHAGYPSTYVYDNNENIEGKLAFNFFNEHILNEGEICEDVLAVAYSESEPSLYFKNVVSLLKFQAPEFTEDITEIRISTSEPLAGCVYVDYIDATWAPDESEETFNEVILTAKSGKFEVGKTYYVPVLPGKKTNLTVYINGYHAATVKEFECKRSVIHNIGTLPEPENAVLRINNKNGWGELNITIKQGTTTIVNAKPMVNEGNNIFAYSLDPQYIGKEVTYFIGHSWYTTSTKTTTLKADSEATAITLNTTYLQPNDWNSDSPRYGAHIWITGQGGIWKSAVKVNDNFYEVEIPDGNYTNIIWCRMNPNNAANDWSSVWNQTGDLTLKHKCYCIQGKDAWNKPTGDYWY